MIHAYNYPFKILTASLWILGELFLDLSEQQNQQTHSHTYTKSDWELWTAAIMTNTATRDMFIDSVYKYAADGESNKPLGDWYETHDGTVYGFRARPVVGGHLALVSVANNAFVNVLIWSIACFVKC